jgi:hypothetical protein
VSDDAVAGGGTKYAKLRVAKAAATRLMLRREYILKSRSCCDCARKSNEEEEEEEQVFRENERHVLDVSMHPYGYSRHLVVFYILMMGSIQRD